MKCEYFDGCPVYARHGDALCERLFCADRCPENRIQEPGGRGQESGGIIQESGVRSQKEKPRAAVRRGKR